MAVLPARCTGPPSLALRGLADCEAVIADVDGSMLWLRVRFARICATGASAALATCACGVLPRVLTMVRTCLFSKSKGMMLRRIADGDARRGMDVVVVVVVLVFCLRVLIWPSSSSVKSRL